MKSIIHTEISQLFQDHQDHLFVVGPQDEETILAAESKIGYPLPVDYRSFVAEYGTVAFMGEEVFGITGRQAEANSIPDVVWATLNQRDTIGLPNNYLPIYAIGDGRFVYIKLGDLSHNPVVLLLWRHHGTFEEILESSNFEEWFFCLIKEAIDSFEADD